MIDESAICQRFAALQPVLDERGRRRLAAAARATGIARSTIGRGLKKLRSRAEIDPTRGRKPMTSSDIPQLIEGSGKFLAFFGVADSDGGMMRSGFLGEDDRAKRACRKFPSRPQIALGPSDVHA